MIKRAQNRIAESRNTLGFSVIYSIAVWLLTDVIHTSGMWWSLGIFTICTYLMVEFNNRFALLRVYSRTVSSSYIFLGCMASWLFCNYQPMLMSLGTIVTLMLLFSTYQQRDAAGHTYSAFLILGMMSILWPPVIWMAFIMWFAMVAYLMSMNFKSFLASVFGMLTPYWILLPAALFMGRIDDIIMHFQDMLPVLDMSDFAWPMADDATQEPYISIPFDILQKVAVTLGVTFIVVFTSIIHYFNKSYGDKIQTRMYYFTFITISILLMCLLAAAIFLPVDGVTIVPLLYCMLIVTTSPLLAHYVTFTNTIVTNISFFVFIVMVIAATFVNIFLL